MEASKFELGQDDKFGGPFTSVDENLGDFPGGYGESRIVLMPRDPQWAYTYWDVPAEHKDDLRRQGGARLALRFYDVTDIDLSYQAPHSLQQYECDEMARDWYIPIPVSDRDYVAEIGYLCNDGRWLVLARSLPVHIPPVYPSDWIEDHFMTVDWQADLRGATLRGARMAGALLFETRFDVRTVLPDGKQWSPQRDLGQFIDSQHPQFVD